MCNSNMGYIKVCQRTKHIHTEGKDKFHLLYSSTPYAYLLSADNSIVMVFGNACLRHGLHDIS